MGSVAGQALALLGSADNQLQVGSLCASKANNLVLPLCNTALARVGMCLC